MKSRLGQPSLTTMEITFAGYQTFTKENFGALKTTTFNKVLVIVDQHIFYPFWIAYKKSASVPKLDRGDIAKLSR
jgi:hypothetical protein